MATNMRTDPPPRSCGDVFILMVNARDSAAPFQLPLKIFLRT